MTYGQTLGFLRNPETMWWGTLGTTVKGSIWGLLGGMVLAMGLIHNRLSRLSVIGAFFLLMAGMLAGFKLINQPMIIYFSDPANPRPESWGALLVGSIALFIYLRIRLDAVSFRIITRFTLLGMVGGGLGFGLGGFWIVLGSHLPGDVIFNSWWKAMEFSFGLLLGAFFGLAAWTNRKAIAYITGYPGRKTTPSTEKIAVEFVVTLIIGILIFHLFSAWLDPIVDSGLKGAQFTPIGTRDIAIIFSNYAFYGFLMIMAVMYFPVSAWQIAIVLTFCHTVIDLSQDIFPDTPEKILLTSRLALIISMTLGVAILTAWFRHRKNILNKMFLLLTWSTVIVAFLRFFYQEGVSEVSGLSLYEMIFGRFFVQIIFLTSAVIITIFSLSLTRESHEQ
jgi:hypothetical protein